MNLADAVEGVLAGKRYLIHDRDPLFTAEFLEMLGSARVKPGLVNRSGDGDRRSELGRYYRHPWNPYRHAPEYAA